MPLYDDAEKLIRTNLSALKRGLKPRWVVVGYLTDTQLEDINTYRLTRNWEPIGRDIVFFGKHVYESRVIEDGYSDDDLLAQIRSACSKTCKYIKTQKMTVLQNPAKRDGGYGCKVRDELTLECSGKYPKSELLSVVPRGDVNHKPNKLREAAIAASLVEELTNTPG
jgi:hypothetical protein